MTFFVLLALIHLMPILQGCPSCPEPMHFRVPAAQLEIREQDDTSDRRHIRFMVRLLPNDSLRWLVTRSMVPAQAISAALATSCPRDEVSITSRISQLEVLQLMDTVNTHDATEDFVISLEDGFYSEIQPYFFLYQSTAFELVYKEIPDEDRIGFVVNATLEDSRVLSDTINLKLE